jgi:hypothetical protein
MVDERGKIVPPWNTFFQQFTNAPSGIRSALVNGSPFNFQASELGTLFISGGTVTAISFKRGGTALDMTGLKLIPVARLDQVLINYTVKPNVQFIPFYATPNR